MNKLKLLSAAFCFLIFNCARAQWTSKANFTNGRSGASAFALGTKGYAGLGISSFSPLTFNNDWWEYNPSTNVWTQKANFGGAARSEACSFSIGTKGYICLGHNINAATYYNDLWEYDATANTWTAKASFIGSNRRGAAEFAVGTNAYIGTGSNSSGYLSDFYKYSQATNTWTAIASYPFTCSYSGSFSDGTFGYIVGGALNPGTTNAVYQYNTSANTWTAKAAYTGAGRYDFFSFFLSGKGYIGCGATSGSTLYSDVNIYDPATDSWSIGPVYPGGIKAATISFVNGTKGYAGLGITTGTIYNDFRELTPCTNTATITSSGGTVICGGITLSATTGTGLVYQWKKNGSNISGATASTYSATTAGTYICIVTTSAGCPATSNSITLTSNNPVTGINYTGSWYLCQGNTATLPAVITSGGGTSPTYQWMLNGANINGATASVYNATQSGVYDVKITNTQTGCYSNSSNTITLTFYNGIPAPTIAFVNGSGGCSAVQMQVSNPVQGYQYQWQFNSNNIPGANSSGYWAPSYGNYRCIATNSCGSGGSNTLIAQPSTGYITNAGSSSFCNSSAQLNAPYVANAAYQWYMDNNAIEGANGSAYNATGAGVYSCEILSSCGSIFSNNSITIDGAPFIVNQTPLTFCTGGVVMHCNGGSTATSYQWKINGISIPSGTTPDFQMVQSGVYTCDVTSSLCGAKTSNSLTVTAGAVPQITLIYPPSSSAPFLIDECSFSTMFGAVPANAGNYTLYNDRAPAFPLLTQTSNLFPIPSSDYYHIELNNGCGTSVSNSVGIRNTGYPHKIYADGPSTYCSQNISPLYVFPDNGWPFDPFLPGPIWDSYQWKLNGVNIPGPNGTQFSYGPVQTGWYSCTITNSCGTAQYVDSIYITVMQPTATITPGGNLNFCTGPGISLQANTGAGLTYQWKKNGVNIAGATSSGYLANSTGSFNVIVTNSSGCTKAATPVNITSPPSVTITPQGPTHFCTGASVSLTATSGQTVTYKWKKNGAYINGATGSTYTATSTGSYNCVVTNNFGCSRGGTPVAITGPPSAVISANGPTTFCAGGSVQLSAQSGYIYQWLKNSANIPGATLQNYIAATAGNYKVKVTDIYGCSKITPNANQITVTIPCREGNFDNDFENKVNSDIPITVVPNPFDEEFIVKGLPCITDNKMELTDALGQVVLNQTLIGLASNCKLRTVNIKAGIYFLKVYTPSATKIIKIVKQ